jgi:hypothetical protein
MNATINDKIKELFTSTPDEIGVAFGKKTVNGQSTGELAFMFMVPKKLPLNEIPENEILPTTVDVYGVEYKTDVVEVGEIKLVACDSNTINNCFGWTITSPENQNVIRPIKGGIQISSQNNSPGFPTQITVGTLGFIALDTETNGLVGVTNNHVVVKNAFYTSERPGNNTVIENELDNNVYQNGFSHVIGSSIGKVMRYVPISQSNTNQVDGALIALYSDGFSFSESYQQFGLGIAEPMEFATTAEINNALVGNYPLASSGRSTGAKIGTPCGLIMNALGGMSYVGPYHSNGAEITVLYDDLILFTRHNPDCNYPIYPGDSGSSLLANINGQWKIIGLCFAASQNVGFASRIDHVASQLGIKYWDGTTKPFINVYSKQVKAVLGPSGNKTLECNGRTYWQFGSDNNTNYC